MWPKVQIWWASFIWSAMEKGLEPLCKRKSVTLMKCKWLSVWTDFFLFKCLLLSFYYSLFDVYQIVLIFRIQEVLTLLRNLLSPAPSPLPLLKASVQALITLSLFTLWPAEGTALRPAPPSMLYTEQVNRCIWECLRLFKDFGRQDGVKLQYDTQLSAKRYK